MLPKKQGNMTISAQSIAVLADFGRSRALRGVFAATVLAALALPGAADAKMARRAAGGYDGYWNVLIITQAGSCDPAYNFPFTITGGRISSNGMADVSGSVGGGGGVAVRVSAGGSVATGSGRLAATSGSGRWSGRSSTGVCSGRWQATRS
jgi:hypothetical protein